MSLDLEGVKRVLWEQWDPIGVRQVGGPSDEYDSYAPDVLRLLKSGATKEELVSHLEAIAALRMGLESPAQRAARSLLGLKAADPL